MKQYQRKIEEYKSLIQKEYTGNGCSHSKRAVFRHYEQTG